MVECNEFVVEAKLPAENLCYIRTSIEHNTRQACYGVRFPTVEPVHVVFRLIDLAQVPNVVVVHVAVDVVKLVDRHAAFAVEPDHAVQHLAYIASADADTNRYIMAIQFLFQPHRPTCSDFPQRTHFVVVSVRFL